MTTNFNGNSWDNVKLSLTIGDVENLIFALGTATMPLLSPDGNRSYIATLTSLVEQTKEQYPGEWEDEVVVKKTRVTPKLDPNDNPTSNIS